MFNGFLIDLLSGARPIRCETDFCFRVLGVPSEADTSRKIVLLFFVFCVLGVPSEADTFRDGQLGVLQVITITTIAATILLMASAAS